MSDSNDTAFRPSRNFMSDVSICSANSVAVIVAMIVSPGCVSLCWKFREGVAVVRETSSRQ